MSRWEVFKAALRAMFLLSPPPEPDEDDVSHAARLQFVAGSRHPSECDSGCICRWREVT